MRLVIGGGVSTRKTDPTLLKAVARAHKWFNELVSGRAVFTREIAARERVNERFDASYPPRVSFTGNCSGNRRRSPSGGSTGEALSRGIDIPVDWAKQKVAFGFE